MTYCVGFQEGARVAGETLPGGFGFSGCEVSEVREEFLLVGFHLLCVSTLNAQADLVCKNIGEILKAAGTDYEHVVKTSCFLAEMSDFGAFNSVYEKYFTGKPARSCVAVKQLPKDVLCEVELVAYKD